MEDERHNRGPEGMGWGQGHMGWDWDVCEGVGMWADGQVGSRMGRMGGWHVGMVGVNVGEPVGFTMGIPRVGF